MPTFYIDLRTPEGPDPDLIGAEFSDLEAAYLDVTQAVLDMSAEMLRQRKDPNRLVFEIRDEQKTLLMEVPFREHLRPAERLAPPARTKALRDTLQAELARSRELREDVRAGVKQARAALEQAQQVMRRTRPS